jgi:putative FmdB family regulatory protein
MPIFAYRCEACGHSFDALQKLGADVLTDCPECGAAQLKKQLSAPAFHLKGKGWRNSDDRPKKMDIRPKFVHTFDSAVPHAEHKGSHEHSDSAGQNSSQRHRQGESQQPGHDHHHDHGHSHSHSHSHGHDHSHGHSHAAPSGPGSSKAKAKGGLGKLVRSHVDSGKQGQHHSHGHSAGHSHDHGHSHGPGGHTHGSKIGHKPGRKPKNEG